VFFKGIFKTVYCCEDGGRRRIFDSSLATPKMKGYKPPRCTK